MKWTRRLAASLRQRLYPEEFRLPEADFGEEQLDLLEELIQMIQPTLCQADAAQKQDKRQMARFLADLGTGIWRIRTWQGTPIGIDSGRIHCRVIASFTATL